MLFQTCFFISIAVLVAVAVYTTVVKFRPYKQRRLLQPMNLLMVGTFLSASVLFFPIYMDMFAADGADGKSVFLSVVLSLHNTIRLYIVDGEFSVISDYTALQGGWLADAYNVVASVLFVAAPILTFGAVLSFFENLTARRRYFFGFFRDAYIFSELNERSLTLARSLKKHDRKCVIVFTDVFKKSDEQTFELIEQAKEMNAILFKSDITIVNFRVHSKKAKLYFFLIGDDEVENINQIILLASEPGKVKSELRVAHGYDYPAADNRLYLFSCQNNYDNLTNLFNTRYIKVRKVNDVQSLVYRMLHENGGDLFESAVETGNMVTDPTSGDLIPEKLISVAIVGLGLHGREMLRSLTWFGQLFPYRLEIAGFDKRPNSESRLAALYPELILPPHNHDFETPGEAHYGIDIYGGVDATDYDFEQKITSLPEVTYIMVALGDDDLNIQVATKLRILFDRLGKHPKIHTIVYNTEKSSLFRNGYAQKGTQYDIFFCGDIRTNYSHKCILSAELENEALEKKHMSYAGWLTDGHAEEDKRLSAELAALKAKGGKPYKEKKKELADARARHAAELADYENSFWKIDYNYRSSIASVIHKRYKQKYGLPGATKLPAERTPAERELYRIVEHQRWNAFVRSEGYVFAEKRDKQIKTHHLLIPFADLPPEEQEKDDD